LKQQCKSCGIKVAPVYESAQGRIKPGSTQNGGFIFHWHAEFLNDEMHDPNCCEVRQFYSWKNGPPDLPQFMPRKNFKPNTWYEDRDSDDYRYGRRTGPHSKPGSGHGFADFYSGNEYFGEDSPVIHHDDIYSFMLTVVDVCNGERTIYMTRPIHLQFYGH